MRKTNGGAGLVFLVPIVIFGVFVAMSRGTSALGEISAYAAFFVCVIAATAMQIHTSRLLHDYFEVYAPALAYIPCVGELTIMDDLYKKIGLALYAVAAILLGVSVLPVFKSSPSLAEVPFYLMLVAIGVLVLVQIVKGLGLWNCMHNIEEEWKEHTKHELGSIKWMVWFGFIPFVRCMTFYALCKPLSSMTQFMGITSDVEDEEMFEEE